jgi:hypothetical protein
MILLVEYETCQSVSDVGQVSLAPVEIGVLQINSWEEWTHFGGSLLRDKKGKD